MNRTTAGFTLIELTVIVAIVVALAAVVIPMVGSAKRDGEVAEVLQIVDGLRTACQRYYGDTGQCPVEQSSSTGVGAHMLMFENSAHPGWNGPYIDRALTMGDNPWTGHVKLFADLDTALGGGFDLTGKGTRTVTGPGSFVRFELVPEPMAELIDHALDKGIPGRWDEVGRVRFGAAGGVLDVFLMDLDGK